MRDLLYGIYWQQVEMVISKGREDLMTSLSPLIQYGRTGYEYFENIDEIDHF